MKAVGCSRLPEHCYFPAFHSLSPIRLCLLFPPEHTSVHHLDSYLSKGFTGDLPTHIFLPVFHFFLRDIFSFSLPYPPSTVMTVNLWFSPTSVLLSCWRLPRLLSAPTAKVWSTTFLLSSFLWICASQKTEKSNSTVLKKKRIHHQACSVRWELRPKGHRKGSGIQRFISLRFSRKGLLSSLSAHVQKVPSNSKDFIILQSIRTPSFEKA